LVTSDRTPYDGQPGAFDPRSVEALLDQRYSFDTVSAPSSGVAKLLDELH